MTFLEFADQWTKENIPVRALYGERIREAVMQLAGAFVKLRLSGVSAGMVLEYFRQMFEDYGNS
jgi:hypothetical protein